MNERQIIEWLRASGHHAAADALIEKLKTECRHDEYIGSVSIGFDGSGSMEGLCKSCGHKWKSSWGPKVPEAKRYQFRPRAQ